ncbi:hypothetical protein GCK72_014319 [Caenorhabditis remanei]|uniref:Uncharacterized protein n=1 Tax=Caenorhabditis remanei TaxID=31234 RepID=A0A6A5GU10_CAERE|nr:hypothetical protein GCK72_014319 [Caenorhabditis remanei]KAF1757862.1 hypothetical protein GCK72_014319 [Caenorhabditis remanei]
MSKTEPLLVLLAILVLVSQVFSIPVDNPEPTTEEPVILPPEPLSKIVFVNDLPPEETLQFEFARGARVYVASSRDIEADSYEENIHIFAPNLDGESKKMSEVGRKVDSETGEKQPVFEDLRYSISIRNNNDEKSKTKNPGIIYFLLAPDDEHVSYVFESTRQEKRTIFIQSNNIENHYVTLLNPSGAVRITNIHNIDGLTALTVSAGGLEETKSSNFTIHDIGKDASQTVAPLFFVEPVLTFRKQLSLFPSSFEITAKGVEIQNQVVIPMKWSDWSLGMSPNYMLRNESNSFKYVFNSSIEDSQFDVQMFGEISADSSLTISYNGIEGAGSESFQKKHLKRLSKSLKAQSLTVEYKRAESDTTRGVLVRVECSREFTKL